MWKMYEVLRGNMAAVCVPWMYMDKPDDFYGPTVYHLLCSACIQQLNNRPLCRILYGTKGKKVQV